MASQIYGLTCCLLPCNFAKRKEFKNHPVCNHTIPYATMHFHIKAFILFCGTLSLSLSLCLCACVCACVCVCVFKNKKHTCKKINKKNLKAGPVSQSPLSVIFPLMPAQPCCFFRCNRSGGNVDYHSRTTNAAALGHYDRTIFWGDVLFWSMTLFKLCASLCARPSRECVCNVRPN